MKMRPGLLTLVLFSVLVPSLGAAGMRSPWDVRLPFKEAVIHYTIDGMEKGTETVYVKDYGRRSAKYHKTVTSMMGMTMNNQTVEIITPDWHYEFNLTERTGTKTVNPYKFYAEEFARLSRAEKKNVIRNAEEVGGIFVGNFGGKVEKKAARILGYDCDRATVMGIRSYVIHGTSLPLKIEGNMMGMAMSTVATSIDKGKVDEKYFQFPAGITPVRDERQEEMFRQMAATVVAMLKEPDGAEQFRRNPPIPAPGTFMPKGERPAGAENRENMNMEDVGRMMEALKEMMGNGDQQLPGR